jgi:hypothetical protein
MATSTIPLNKFRLITKVLDSGSNSIYQQIEDVSTIILSCQITNVTSSIQTVSVQIQKSGSVGNVTLLKNGGIPPSESLNPFGGKIVLESSDTLHMSTATSGSLEIVMSVLENANN